MKTENIQILNNRGKRLEGRLYYSESADRGVIFCHGLFSSKDAYKIVNMAEHIANAGYVLLSFDFSFVSESGGDFRGFSIFQEVEDLRCALDFLVSRGINNFHLIGSSMGGVVALMFAAERHPLLRSLILIATPARLSGLVDKMLPLEQIEALPDDGTTEVEGIPVGNGFFKEAIQLDMEARLKKINSPTLILHGADDELVDVSNAEYMNEVMRSERSVFIIEGGEHHLNRDGDLLLMREKILDWIKRHSKGEG
jgi:putative redox protein